MSHPERVAFGLSLAPSSSELMNASMTSLESYVRVFLSVVRPAIKVLFCCNQCLTKMHLSMLSPRGGGGGGEPGHMWGI